MNIAVNVTYREYAKAFFAGSLFIRLAIYILRSLFAFGLLGAILNLVLYEMVSPSAIAITYIPFLTIVGGWSLSPHILAWLSWKSNPMVHGTLHYEIGAQGVSLVTSASTSFTEWSSFTRLRETRGLFLLYISRAFPFIIPKRAFSSASDVTEFRSLANERISKS